MRKYIILFIFIIICSFIIDRATHNVYGNQNGALPAHTGSPHDVITCSNGIGCHGGTATVLSDIITSNVPVTGYIAGITYTITVTVTDPAKIEFGFQISPQDNAGNLLGTIIKTDPARTHFADSAHKYLTHTTAGTAAPGHTDVWQFNWTAPGTGTGCVTFYGAFNFANSNNMATGDIIHKSTLTICENGTGIHDPVVVTSFNAYPNPWSNYFDLTYYLQKTENVEINLLDTRGSLIVQLLNDEQSGGAQNFSMNLDQDISAGIYLLQLKAGKEMIVKKMVKL